MKKQTNKNKPRKKRKKSNKSEYQAYLENKLEFLFFSALLFGPLIILAIMFLIALFHDPAFTNWLSSIFNDHFIFN